MHRPPACTILATLAVAALAGCAPKAAAPAIPVEKPEAVKRMNVMPRVATEDKADHNILREDIDIVLQLDIYTLTIPSGGVSDNTRFWSHIDEDHVDTATHQLLQENGIRYGIGANDDWDYFKGLIDRYGATAQKGSTAPVKQGKLELPLRTNVDQQDVFYFDAAGHQHGRTYEKCDDLLALEFEPTPRRPGDARIAVSALVRGLRRQYEVTILNETREIEFRSPEYLYDLRLKQDVPLDHFLVIAPSAITSLPDNLGHTFFIRPGGAEPMETVLILVPRPYRITGETPNVPLNRVAPGDAPARK